MHTIWPAFVVIVALSMALSVVVVAAGPYWYPLVAGDSDGW